MNQDFDAIIIGAGMSGMYQLLRLRELGMRVRVFETGSGVGGTWYWNRYPGARFDSESYSYGFSFSKELLEEWEWSEHFAGQPETLRYCQFVADKFDLRRDIQFSSRVTAAVYDDTTRSWRIALEDGGEFTGRFLVTAIGPLSTPTLPRIEGRDSFKGQAFHTARWPKQPVGFAGKRVAVIGTGATGVQTIQTIASEVGHLTVFQRTANWAAPLHNGKIDAETQAQIKAGYPEIFARCQETFACFIHTPDPRGAFEVSDREREAHYEKLYGERGFGIWQGNFRDILTDRKANATISDFVARKIREHADTPILMLTARVEESDRLVGLELGADDYVLKPFSPKEVVARVRAVLRRSEAAAPPMLIRLADLVIDPNRHSVLRGTDPVEVTPTEFKLLVTLARDPGRVFSRMQLLDAVGGEAYEGYERTVDAHVKNLRAKLEPDPRRPRYILTVFGVGYKAMEG